LNTSRAFRFSPRPAVIMLLAVLLAGCIGEEGDSWAGLAQDPDPDSDIIYVANEGRVVAVDPHNLNDDNKAQILWEYDEGDKFFAVPTVYEGRIYIGDYKGRLHAIDRQTGEGLILYQPGEEIIFGPISETPEDRIIGGVEINPDEGIAYFGLGSRDVVAVDIDTGEKLWTFATNHGVWASPLYVPASPPADDAPDVVGDSDAAGDAAPAPAQIAPRERAVLYVVSLDKHLYAVDPQSGDQLWRKYLGGAAANQPEFDPVRHRLYVGTFNSEVLAIDLGPDTTNGDRIVDRYSTKDWVWSSPVLADDVIYVGDLAGNVYAVGVSDDGFAEQWTAEPAGDAVRGSPLVLEQQVIVGSKDKRVYGLEKDTGNEIWEMSAGGKVLTELLDLGTVPDSDERLVVVGTDKNSELLTAYRVEADLAGRAWTYDKDTDPPEEQ
jgi:eukaryotic-like serine/threonine-protein kinase